MLQGFLNGNLIFTEKFFRQVIPFVFQCFIRGKQPVRNTGSALKPAVPVIDIQKHAGNILRPEGTLAPGKSMSCIFRGKHKNKSKRNRCIFPFDHVKAGAPEKGKGQIGKSFQMKGFQIIF